MNLFLSFVVHVLLESEAQKLLKCGGIKFIQSSASFSVPERRFINVGEMSEYLCLVSKIFIQLIKIMAENDVEQIFSLKSQAWL